MAKEFPMPISGHQFIEELGKRGIVDANVTRRVVIDAAWEDILLIYIEKAGDERIFDVSLEGAEIKIAGG